MEYLPYKSVNVVFIQYTIWINCFNAPLEKVPKATRLSSVFVPKQSPCCTSNKTGNSSKAAV